MRPVVVSSSSYLAASKYQQRSAPSQKYSLGRSSQEPQLRQSIRQYDRNIYKTPERNLKASVAGAAGMAEAAEHRQPYEGLINKKEEEQDEQLEIRKRRYLHYTADHVSLAANKNPSKELDMSYDLSSARGDINPRGASKENEQRRVQIGSANNSYSGFISRSMNSSFIQRQQTHSPSKVLNDSMISDSSPSNKRLNYSSVLSTTEWSTVAYAVPYPNSIKDKSYSNGFANFGGSMSANKADSMHSSMLLSTAGPNSAAASGYDNIRLCSMSDSKDLKYSLGIHNPIGKDSNIIQMKSQGMKEESNVNGQIKNNNNQSREQAYVRNNKDQSDVFKSIHIEPKSALALLETLDTADIASKKAMSMNSMKKDNNNNIIDNSRISNNQTQLGSNKNNISENIIVNLNNSTVNNSIENDKPLPVRTNNNNNSVNSSLQLKYTSSHHHPSSSVVVNNNYCINYDRQKQQQEQQQKQILSANQEQQQLEIPKELEQLRHKSIHDQPQQLLHMSAQQRLSQLQSEEKNTKDDDRQRAIQERFRRVDEITKKYAHLYKQINTDNTTPNENNKILDKQINKVQVIQQEGSERKQEIATEKINEKDKQIGIAGNQQLLELLQRSSQVEETTLENESLMRLEMNNHKDNESNSNQDKKKQPLMLKEEENNSLHILDNNQYSTPRFPTAPGVSYFASAEQIKLFSANKNKPKESNNSLISQMNINESSLQQETLETLEDE